MSQAGVLVTGTAAPSNVAINYITDNGTAVPSNNDLNVLGAGGLSTSGAGNTITITPPFLKFTSATIDFTVTGTTTLFTNGASEFVPYCYTFISDSVTNFSGDGQFNLGFTGPNYTDYVNSVAFGMTDVNQFSSFMIDEPGGVGGFALLPPATALVLNITSAITADIFTGRVVVFGFTI